MFSRKDLFKLLGPLIVEQILAVLVGMVDIVMVATVGEMAVSGVALVDSISLLIIQFLAALATGGAVVCSQYVGKQDRKKACEAAGQLLLVTTVASILFAGIALVGNRRLLSLIFGRVEQGVMNNAVIYFWLTAMSYPFLAVYNSCAALFRSMGNSKVSMFTSIIMNLINIVGNAVCIFGLKMGVEGVAIPTLLSRVVAAFLMVILIQDPGNAVRIESRKALYPNGGMIRRILGVGIPSGLENGMFQFGKITLQSLVSTLGTAAIAGFAVSSNLVTLQYLPGNAIGLGLITIVGQCVGAGKLDEAKRYTKSLIALNYGLLILICGGMALGIHPLVNIYNLSPEASKLAIQMILVHACAMVIWPPSFALPNALRAAMDVKFTMTVSIFSMWMFRIAFAYLFVVILELGVMGIWYGMFIDWAFRAAMFLWRFHNFSGHVKKI